VATVQETVQVRGIRCERCMARLAHVLKDHDGLESANATLTGVVTLTYDDEQTTRDALLEAMVRGGFREQQAAV
jgi:copper chaperone CopZ